MGKPNNEMLSDLANVYLNHDRLDRVLEDQKNLSNDDFNQLAEKLQSFHSETATFFRELFETLPDVPVHSSMSESSTFGLPMNEYSLQDLESKPDNYIISAILEAETGLRKYYQDTMKNHNLPDDYRKGVKKQLNKLSDYLSELERIKKVSDE